jgi:predicted nucleic acid-binding protein
VPDQYIKTRYLDASALVKLVIDEQDCAPLRSFFQSNSHFCSTSLCLAEALGVIKSKWAYKHISEEKYFQATRELITNAWGNKIEIDNLDVFSPEGLSPVEALAQKHKLDLSDALQIHTILRGTYSALGPNSASILITADAKLASAANAEGIRAWNCIATSLPDWA